MAAEGSVSDAEFQRADVWEAEALFEVERCPEPDGMIGQRLSCLHRPADWPGWTLRVKGTKERLREKERRKITAMPQERTKSNVLLRRRWLGCCCCCLWNATIATPRHDTIIHTFAVFQIQQEEKISFQKAPLDIEKHHIHTIHTKNSAAG